MAGGNVPGNLARLFVAAGRANRIPPSVLAGVASVESNFGANKGPSSAGAIGTMQFMPGTARGLGINPLDDRQAVYGAAKLLNQYGFQRDPTRALAAYNAGPGNYRAGLGYAQQVKSEASRVGSQLGGVGQLGGGVPTPTPTIGPQKITQESLVPTFDQKGYQRAQGLYQLGRLVSSTKNPWADVPGIGKAAANPLLASGVLPTQAPSVADFQGLGTKSHTYTLAQNGLQSLTHVPLNSHKGLGGDFSTPTPRAIIDMQNFAKTLIGAPYSQANHAASFSQGANIIKRYGTDCSGLVSLLLGRAGVIDSPQTTETIAATPGIQPGRGAHVTIWNRAGAGSNSHMIVQIGQDWFESGGRIGHGVVQMSNPQAQQELGGGGFRPLHPRGM